LRRSSLVFLLLLAGCGSPAAPDEPAAVERPRANGLHPRLRAPLLLEMRRTTDQAGASDEVTYGTDGSAVMVKAYGGGGYYAWRCRLTPAELRSIRAELRALPLDRAPRVPEQHRTSLYAPQPARFTLRTPRYADGFSEAAVPSDAKPLKDHMERMLVGREGDCEQTFGQRVR
jgi:hypothetical protein